MILTSVYKQQHFHGCPHWQQGRIQPAGALCNSDMMIENLKGKVIQGSPEQVNLGISSNYRDPSPPFFGTESRISPLSHVFSLWIVDPDNIPWLIRAVISHFAEMEKEIPSHPQSAEMNCFVKLNFWDHIELALEITVSWNKLFCQTKLFGLCWTLFRNHRFTRATFFRANLIIRLSLQ